MKVRLALGLLLVVCLMGLLYGTAMASRTSVTIDRQIEPPHLDPTRTASASTAEVTHLNVFQGLTRIDQDSQVLPALATAWQASEDGLQWTFQLRENVKFHDGQPFDAQVAAFSLQRLLDPQASNPQRQLFDAIENVTVESRYRLGLQLSRPDALLPFRLALSAAVMVHPDSVTNNDITPVGTGPYRVLPWTGGSVSISYFSDYWGESPAIHDATFSFTANRLELESKLSVGSVDLYADASPLPSHLQLVLRGDYQILEGSSEGEVILAMNHEHPALADVRVRRALSHAIDKQTLLSIYSNTSPKLIGSHFSPHHPAYLDLVDYYPYDPVRARQLLDDAGYANALELTLSLPPPIYAERGGLFIASDLEAVGIDVTLERLAWGEWLDRVFTQRDYDLTLVSHVEPFDIGIYARDDYYFNYVSEPFQALWQEVERTQETLQQYHLLQEAQRLLAEDAVNVFLYMKPQHSIHRAGLKGVWQDSPIPAVVVEEMYWE